MTRDSLDRRKRLKPQSTGKRVSPQERDLLWFSKLAEHGPLPSSFLLEYCKSTHRSEKRGRERLTDLFNEDNTPDGGAYLTRPLQQFRTLDARYNQLVYDLTPAAERALERAGKGKARKTARSGPWVHSLMVSCITASIELACNGREDVSYIRQSQILQRADTELRHAVKVSDPSTGKVATKDLLPDALFGLEYRIEGQRRYRFFIVEADRATEPATSRNFNRKSVLRNVLQYARYIEGGAYREHLKLTAPLLVLNVVPDETRLQKLVEVTTARSPHGNSYMLFQSWPDFTTVFRPPKPNSGLLNGKWCRGGMCAMRIDRV